MRDCVPRKHLKLWQCRRPRGGNLTVNSSLIVYVYIDSSRVMYDEDDILSEKYLTTVVSICNTCGLPTAHVHLLECSKCDLLWSLNSSSSWVYTESRLSDLCP